MGEPDRGGGIQRGGDLRDEPGGVGGRGRTIPPERDVERVAEDELHGEVRHALFDAAREWLHNRRVRKPAAGDRGERVTERGDLLVVCGEGEGLDGDDPIEPRLPSLQHRSEGTDTHLVLGVVGAEGRR